MEPTKKDLLKKIDDILEQVNRLAKEVEKLEGDESTSMPAYILLKDMPQIEAGTVFVHDKNDHEKGSIGCGCLKNAWDNGMCQRGRHGTNSWAGGTHIIPGQLANDRDWFNPCENDGRYFAK